MCACHEKQPGQGTSCPSAQSLTLGPGDDSSEMMCWQVLEQSCACRASTTSRIGVGLPLAMPKSTRIVFVECGYGLAILCFDSWTYLAACHS